MQCQNSANDILTYRSSKCEIDLVGDTRAAPGWIVPFHFDHDTNEVGIRPLWSAYSSALAKTATDTSIGPLRDGNSIESKVWAQLPHEPDASALQKGNKSLQSIDPRCADWEHGDGDDSESGVDVSIVRTRRPRIGHRRAGQLGKS